MSATYWEIGQQIVQVEQDGSHRAEYDEALIDQLAMDMTERLGRGFGNTDLHQMRAFYLAWPPEQIRQTVPGELPATVTRLSALLDHLPCGRAPEGQGMWVKLCPLPPNKP